MENKTRFFGNAFKAIEPDPKRAERLAAISDVLIAMDAALIAKGIPEDTARAIIRNIRPIAFSHA